MFTGNKRSDLEVVADILRMGGSRTSVMYGANLSYTQTRKYLGLLTERGFIELVALGNKRLYRPTAKGRKLLELIGALEELATEPASLLDTKQETKGATSAPGKTT